VNLSWLVTPGSVQSALITGVLGIPADPRLVEVLGWLAYLIPVSLYVYWPQARRPGRRAAARLKFAIAGLLAAAALGLALFYPVPHPALSGPAPLVEGSDGSAQPVGTAELEKTDKGLALKVSVKGAPDSVLPLPANAARQERRQGIATSAWTIDSSGAPANSPSTLTLDQVVALSGGRIPVGLSPSRNPGPFSADWSVRGTTEIWASGGMLIDAAQKKTTVLTLSGGGLLSPRTLTVRVSADEAANGWHVSPDYRERAQAEMKAIAAARTERRFWAVQLPTALVLIALLAAASAARSLMRPRPTAASTGSKAGPRADKAIAKGVTHAAH
jgi:high-affinity iron transporter